MLGFKLEGKHARIGKAFQTWGAKQSTHPCSESNYCYIGLITEWLKLRKEKET